MMTPWSMLCDRKPFAEFGGLLGGYIAVVVRLHKQHG
jgi:hypothetical protein